MTPAAPAGNQRYAWQSQQAMLSWKSKEKPYMTIHLPEPLQADIRPPFIVAAMPRSTMP